MVAKNDVIFGKTPSPRHNSKTSLHPKPMTSFVNDPLRKI